MQKTVLALCVATALAGCSTLNAITGATITQSQVDAARNAYDGTYLASLHRYALLPKCKTGQTFLNNQCHDAGLLKTLRAADQAVGADFNAVQSNLDSGNTNALSNSWSVLQNAISSAKSLLTQNSIP